MAARGDGSVVRRATRALTRAFTRGRAAPQPAARGTTTTLVVAAEPDAALMASAAALRRLGAKIVRYDADDSALEARLVQSGFMVVRATAETDGTARLDVQTDAARPRAALREFRREISGRGARR